MGIKLLTTLTITKRKNIKRSPWVSFNAKKYHRRPRGYGTEQTAPARQLIDFNNKISSFTKKRIVLSN